MVTNLEGCKILRALWIAIILFLLVAITATPATAQSITLLSPSSPDSGTVGSSVRVNGTGLTSFNQGAPFTITFYNATFTAVVASGYISTPGSLSLAFTVPECPRAMYTVQVTLETYSDSAAFTVIPAIELNPSSGYVGKTVQVSGTGFAASKDITITFDNMEIGTAETNILGSFTNATFTVPESYYGNHTVTATDNGGYFATAMFIPRQLITITPISGVADDEVIVYGTGFIANKPITITFDADVVTTSPVSINTDSKGSFSGSFLVSSSVSGTHKVRASDGVNTIDADFTIEIGARLDPTVGNVGTKLTINGSGFKGTVRIQYDDTELTTVTADSNGAFFKTFNAPPSTGGDHTITVTDGTNSKELTFTMESTPPPIPMPLLPAMNSKAETASYFDWDDVTDPSIPVTYTLQIASDANFTTSTMVLEKKGLTESEYTITTKEEKPLSTKKEALYYWRVKAIDGAFNESRWSDAQSFYVGFSFSLPGWALYTIIGLGVLLVGFLSFRVGRKTAYS